MTKQVVFLGTGGTIAGRAIDRSDNVGYRAALVGVAQLLEGLPALVAGLACTAIESEQVSQVDSKDMDWSHWRDLHARSLHHLQRKEVDALVITHGTDTLEETAFFLSRVLPQELLASKPVVLTCAMRPSTAEFPDGPQNLCDAAVVVSSPDASGVLVVCAGMVHTAWDVQKTHPYRLDAFSSGDVGPVGWVEEGQVRWVRPVVQNTASAKAEWQFPSHAWPRVEVVLNAVGIGGAAIRALCAEPAWPDAPVRGIVVAGTGNGTINCDMEAALAVARAQGIRVVITTRCVSGQLVSARGTVAVDSEYEGLSVVKARIALVLELLELR